MADLPVNRESSDSAPADPGPDAIVILCALPEDFDAESLAAALLKRSLAACVQVGAEMTSIYRWKGAIEKSAERLILIKTRAAFYPQVEATIRALHPYEVPEIIALKVCAGYAPYLAWLAAETSAG